MLLHNEPAFRPRGNSRRLQETRLVDMGRFDATRDRVPARYILCFMFFLGGMVTFLLRVNINLTIVAMIRSPATENATQNATGQLSSKDMVGGAAGFDWDELQQSMILGSFFWGYLIFQAPAGRIAEIYGSKRVMGFAVLLNGLLSLVTPSVTRLHWSLLLVVRAAQGLAQGVQYPALNAAVAKWIPMDERARFLSFAVQGASLGTVVSMPLCGAVALSCGWEAVFYMSGGVALAWCVAWGLLVFDCPEQHPRLSAHERIYLQAHLKDDVILLPLPWRSVLTSTQFLIACIASLGNDWGFHTLITLGPKYMKEHLQFDLEQSSWLTSLPFFCQYVFANVYGLLVDYSLKCGTPVARVRKLSVVVSHMLPAVGLFVLAFSGCGETSSIAVLTFSVAMIGAFSSGYFQTPLDIAPNFAGSLTGIMNTVGSVTGVISPPLAGAALHKGGIVLGWKIIFAVAASMYLASSLPFMLFATAHLQPWNDPRRAEKVLTQELMVPKKGEDSNREQEDDDG